MAPKTKGENTKKAAGNAKKAEVAAQKAAANDAVKSKAEEGQWKKGAKDTSKADAAAEKAAEAQRKKAEKAALLAEEEKSLPSKPVKKPGGALPKAKPAEPKRGLDLGQLEREASPLNRKKGADAGEGALTATNIDDALTALSLTQGSGASEKVENHPERRVKAAYTQFEERRLEEMKDDKSLRRQQKITQIRKEFEKSPENPFNQGLVGRYDLSKEEAAALKEEKRKEVESRLGAAG